MAKTKEDSAEKTMYPDERREHIRHTKKLSMEYEEYNIYLSDDIGQDRFLRSHTVNISSGGLMFQGIKPFKPGTLLKIKLKVPGYWDRKSKFVKYGHVAKPKEMSILAKVIRSESMALKRKHRIAVEMVNIDQIDGQVLTDFLALLER